MLKDDERIILLILKYLYQESTGAKIVIIQESAEFDTEKPLRITGPPESVERAKSMVSEILNQNDVS